MGLYRIKLYRIVSSWLIFGKGLDKDLEIVTIEVPVENISHILDGGFVLCNTQNKRLARYDEWHDLRHGKLFHKCYRKGNKITTLRYIANLLNETSSPRNTTKIPR